jgi:hypothetical protein
MLGLVGGFVVAVCGADWRLVLAFAQDRHAGARIVWNDDDPALRATGRGISPHEREFGADRGGVGEAREFVDLKDLRSARRRSTAEAEYV